MRSARGQYYLSKYTCKPATHANGGHTRSVTGRYNMATLFLVGSPEEEHSGNYSSSSETTYILLS